MDAALILADVVERFSVRRWRSSLLRGFPLRLWRGGFCSCGLGLLTRGVLVFALWRPFAVIVTFLESFIRKPGKIWNRLKKGGLNDGF